MIRVNWDIKNSSLNLKYRAVPNKYLITLKKNMTEENTIQEFGLKNIDEKEIISLKKYTKMKLWARKTKRFVRF